MKGIVLTGGLGTRLYPVTRVVNKHILPVGDKPMFYHPLLTLVASGIKEMAVVSGPPFGDQIKELLKYLPVDKKVQITYVEQPAPAGMPDGIFRCAGFVKNDPVMVIAGDNLYGGDFKNEVKNFKTGALSFLRRAENTQRFGVAVYDVDGSLMGLIEKPENFKTKWAVSGPHLFDNQVFKLIKKLKPSARGELEITDLNSEYAKMGLLKLVKRVDYWQDMGTFDSLINAGQYKGVAKP